MLRQSTKTFPLALLTTVTLALTGCAATSADSGGSPTPSGTAGAGAESESAGSTFEFQTPRYGSEGALTVRLPAALLEAAGSEADGLLVTSVTAEARELESSRYCAVDLAITYTGEGSDVLGQSTVTDPEATTADELTWILQSEFGVDTMEQFESQYVDDPAAQLKLEELTAGMHEGLDAAAGKADWENVAGRLAQTPTPGLIESLDASNPQAGVFISEDVKTLTFVEQCSESEMDEDHTGTFMFPVQADEKIETFASIEISVMKSGTLTITEASVTDYELDTNGDWIGG